MLRLAVPAVLLFVLADAVPGTLKAVVRPLSPGS
jgi:hypothetical protein